MEKLLADTASSQQQNCDPCQHAPATLRAWGGAVIREEHAGSTTGSSALQEDSNSGSRGHQPGRERPLGHQPGEG